MKKFIERINTLSTENSEETSVFLILENFKKSFPILKYDIEESLLSGNYSDAKNHIVWMGNELSKLYEKVDEMELNDCDCIPNITKEEFEKFLKEIGGLENGYSERYFGNNKIRKFLFNITSWILYKLPYYEKSKIFSKENSITIFINNCFYKLFKPVLKDKKPKNPFRSVIDKAGYFEIGPGWYGLVKTLISEAIEKGWNKEICQVKEKFGGLRFYTNGITDEVRQIINKYEEKSYEICEECGEKGQVRSGGWIQTLCDKHYNKN